MQNVIGNVGGTNKIIDVQLTVQAAAYATGEIIGGKITIPKAMARDGGSGLLKSVLLCSKADLTVNMDLVLFSEDPSGTTFSENNAVAIATTDVAKVLGAVQLATRFDIGTPVVAGAYNVDMVVQSAADSRSLFACLIARGAYTPAATADVILRFGIQRDL
jgi:hypothetical protein